MRLNVLARGTFMVPPLDSGRKYSHRPQPCRRDNVRHCESRKQYARLLLSINSPEVPFLSSLPVGYLPPTTSEPLCRREALDRNVSFGIAQRNTSTDSLLGALKALPFALTDKCRMG
jgi:hypothetical protein